MLSVRFSWHIPFRMSLQVTHRRRLQRLLRIVDLSVLYPLQQRSQQLTGPLSRFGAMTADNANPAYVPAS